MKDNKNHYIIIDDNEIDIFIALKMIQLSYPEAKVTTFNNAMDALELVKNGQIIEPVIMLIDINMPIMNGFQFIEEFEKLPIERQKIFTPYFLSSSINESDIAFAKTFKSIKKFINKPLVSNFISDL